MQLGLCVSPGFIPPAGELAQLRPSFLRSILYRLADLDALEATGLPLFITLNNECAEVGWDWSGWQAALTAIAARPERRVFGVGCGNELDLFWSRNPDDVPPEFAAGLVKSAAPILRPVGIQVVATSLAGPAWQTYLARLAEQSGDDVDLYDLHAYGQRPDGWGRRGWGFGDLREALSRARAIAGRPVMMSEYGVKVGDAGGEEQAAAFLTAAAATLSTIDGADVFSRAAWFAYTDAIGASNERGEAAFGLVAEDGRRRPAWDAFAALAASTIDVVSPDPDPPLPPPEPVPVHVVDPGPPPEPVLSAREAAWRDLWQSATAPPAPVPFNPDAAFYRYWQANRETAGLPVGPEHADEEGVFQAFSRAGVLKWSAGEDVTAA